MRAVLTPLPGPMPAASTPPGRTWEPRHSAGFLLVAVLVFAVPWGDMVNLPYDVQASRVLTVAAAVGWAVTVWAERQFRPPRGVHLAMLIFAVWAGANVFWTLDPARSARRMLSYCQLFFDAWLIYQVAAATGQHRKLLQAYVLGCYVGFGGLMWNFFHNVYQGDGRYTAPGCDPNDLAVTLALGVPMAWYLAITSRSLLWINRLYIPCALSAGLLTASRSGVVALAVAMGFPLLAMPRISTRKKVSLLALAALSAGALFAFASESSVRRLSTIVDQLMARDLNGRVQIWLSGVDVFLEHPLAGVGAGAFGASVLGRQGSQTAAHNTFLGVLVEHGLPGLLAFCAIVAALVRSNRRRPTLDKRLWLVILSCWLVAVSTLSWENRQVTWTIWGLCSAGAYRRFHG